MMMCLPDAACGTVKEALKTPAAVLVTAASGVAWTLSQKTSIDSVAPKAVPLTVTVWKGTPLAGWSTMAAAGVGVFVVAAIAASSLKRSKGSRKIGG